MLKAVLLQTPDIELDGEPVSFPFRRAEALLYYMLVQRSATRQELVSLLWEDCDEATGLKNLRNTLYSLKKTLGGEFLVSRQKSSVVTTGSREPRRTRRTLGRSCTARMASTSCSPLSLP